MHVKHLATAQQQQKETTQIQKLAKDLDIYFSKKDILVNY